MKKNTALDVQQNYKDFVDNLKTARKAMTMMRIGFTSFLLAWLVLVLRCIFRGDYPTEEIKRNRTEQCFYAHRTLFGDESILYILFRVWYITILVMIMVPIFYEFFIFYKTKPV